MTSTDFSWQPDTFLATAAPPVRALFDALHLTGCPAFPTASELSETMQALHPAWEGPLFVAQSELNEDDPRYYEEIIGSDNRIPTREHSWHDLFNACIWMQFPQAKLHLNQLHVDDIRQHGVHPRTPRRNRLTHFDECGVVLAVEQRHRNAGNALLSGLAEHAWLEVLWHHRQTWLETITPLMFGHANLEMMLAPFTGLTGKWLAVMVPDGFRALPQVQQWAVIDAAVTARITALDDFQQPDILRPLPLLGVPGWWPHQRKQFYQDTGYFRPQRANTPRTVQLPL